MSDFKPVPEDKVKEVVEKKSEVSYFAGRPYRLDHWSLEDKVALKKPELICTIKDEKLGQFELYVNPTDMRCGRLILRYIGEGKVKTINTRISHAARLRMNEIASSVEEAFVNLGMFPQMAKLGNNSHMLVDGKFVAGTPKEPSFDHIHIWGRTAFPMTMKNPSPGYGAPEVTLVGPKVGEVFDLRKGKVKWDKESLRAWRSIFIKHFAEVSMLGPGSIRRSYHWF